MVANRSDKKNSVFEFGFNINAKILVNLAVVFPHILVFKWHQRGVKSVYLNPSRRLEEILDHFVLLVKRDRLTSIRTGPAIFSGLPTENYQLKVI